MSKSSRAKRKAKRETVRAAVMHNCKVHTQEAGLARRGLSRIQHAYELGLAGAEMPQWIATDRTARVAYESRGFHYSEILGRGGVGYGFIRVVDHESTGIPGAFLKAYNSGKRDAAQRQKQEQAAELKDILAEWCRNNGMVPTPENLKFAENLAKQGTI